MNEYISLFSFALLTIRGEYVSGRYLFNIKTDLANIFNIFSYHSVCYRFLMYKFCTFRTLESSLYYVQQLSKVICTFIVVTYYNIKQCNFSIAMVAFTILLLLNERENSVTETQHS